MKFDSAIYREIQNYDVGEFLKDCTEPEDWDDRYNIVQHINALDQFDRPYEKLSEEELDELNIENVLRIKVIDVDSLIFKGLREWFGGFENVIKGVRSGYYDHEAGKLYFGTGIGYDTTSDLLACDCDGIGYDEFINFCNEDYEIMKQGGYNYLKSKNKEFCAYDKLKELSMKHQKKRR